MQKYKILKNNSGYTIIETMIAVSIFLIVVTIGMGALLNANLLHQKSKDMRSAIDNLSFVMEDISRNLRTGTNYRCLTGADTLSTPSIPLSCAGGWGIAFESSGGDPLNNNDQWVYYIANTGKLFKATVGPYNGTTSVQLTPDEMYISPISSFEVIGAEKLPLDKQQPFVTIRLVGRIVYKDVVTPFSLQTSVSERILGL